MFGIENVSAIINSVAEEMDSIAAKLGPDILLSPTGLLVICSFVFGIIALAVWHSRNPKKEDK